VKDEDNCLAQFKVQTPKKNGNVLSKIRSYKSKFGKNAMIQKHLLQKDQEIRQLTTKIRT
jgi:hypothetical protein